MKKRVMICLMTLALAVTVFSGTKLEAMAAVPENIQGTYVYGNGVTISADEITAPLNWGDVVTLPLAKEDAFFDYDAYSKEVGNDFANTKDLSADQRIEKYFVEKEDSYTFFAERGVMCVYRENGILMLEIYNLESKTSEEGDKYYSLGMIWYGSPLYTAVEKTEEPKKDEPKEEKVPEPSFEETLEKAIDTAVEAAVVSGTDTMQQATVKVSNFYKKGITLSNSVMKKLIQNSNVSLELEYYYEGVYYKVIIPAGEAPDDDIPWYGPLYLAGRYGNRATVNN